ncbi:MAG: START-like domain-containing protein [Crocinitomicaceae bacterium]
MATKDKFELEFLLKTSAKVLDGMISTPSGLSEWFADDVNIKDDVFTFFWDGSEEEARLLTKKTNSKVKWQWIEDEEDELDTYFEIRYEVDPMTKAVILTITDFAEADEKEEAQRLWENQIGELKRTLGA